MFQLPSVIGCGRPRLGFKAPLTLILAAVTVAGCSADVERFDSTSFAFNDPPAGSTSAPAPVEPVYSGGVDSHPVATSVPRGPYSAGAGSIESSTLPDATPVSAPLPPPAAPSYQARPFQTARADASLVPSSVPATHSAASGETIEVQRGDTLYGLSRRHRVSVNELMKANGLRDAHLKPGQKLQLPSGSAAGAAPSRAVAEARDAQPAIAPVSADVDARYRGTYTVKSGDSLYSIARANNVKTAELQRVNGISDPRRVMPGTVLKVPGIAPIAAADSIAAPAVRPIAAPVAPQAVSDTLPRRYGTTTAQPTVINSGREVAELSNTQTDASPMVQPVVPDDKVAPKADKVAAAPVQPEATVQSGGSDKLRWPAEGRIISAFGGRPDGTHNDGINLSVPLGTDVHAADNGVVAYAGSELKGYGNLILIRHDNGWVTAYAHNDELLVQRGDKIKRGQVIAKAGRTGSVDQPQVHFELRQGSKPVDPTPFMEAKT